MICQYCSKPAKSLNSKRQHEIRCKNNPTRLDMSYNKFNFKNPAILPTPCAHCEKIYETKIALSNHIRRCPKNPNRVMEILTSDGREKIRAKNLSFRHSDETKKKLSVSMKRAVENNPESYSSSNRGRTKQIIVDGIKLQGQWEVDFYNWAKIQGLNPKRPTESFTYKWDGSRSYFPDFYIESLDMYVEVKGYETDRDRAKWLTFPKKLSIVKATEIKKIKNNTFTVDNLLNKCYSNNMGG
jgi:hypothetical protein